jgi:alanine transaminase
LTAGASSGVNTLLHVICSGPKTGVLVPIPQYPLYTATLSLIDATCVPYYLDEAKAWGTNLDAIKESLAKARSEGIDVRALVVINPGNPTGASLGEADIHAVLKLAAEEKLVVMADEVYQTNVFLGEFFSFKKCLLDIQKEEPGKYDVELVSFHSVSKGMVGECGHRGGFFELVGFDKDVAAQIFKFISIMLCPPVVGQCMVECMVNPPKEGEPSYELYKKEYDGIYQGLKKRALAIFEAFKQMEGVECQDPQVSGSVELGYTDIYREQCIFSRASRCQQRPLRRQNQRAMLQMSFIVFNYSKLLEFVLYLVQDLDKQREHFTFVQRFWHQVRNGLVESLNFTRSSWKSINRPVRFCRMY